MDTSAYQYAKLIILDAVNLSRDAVHIHVGLAAFVVAVVFWKRGRVDAWCLVPVFFFAGLMEALDLRDDLRTFGYMRFSASAHDLVNTVFWPVVITSLVKIRDWRTGLRRIKQPSFESQPD